MKRTIATQERQIAEFEKENKKMMQKLLDQAKGRDSKTTQRAASDSKTTPAAAPAPPADDAVAVAAERASRGVFGIRIAGIAGGNWAGDGFDG